MKPQTFRSIGRYLVILFATLMAVFCGTKAAAQIYVDIDATETPDGESWLTAYTDLQDAIAFARDNPELVDQIWVAEGTYKPDNADAGDRTLSFDLTGLDPTSTLEILGGFDGTETMASQRRPAGNPTILSGDLNSDDGANFANRSDNSYHVIRSHNVGDTVIVDGFTITAGNAVGASSPVGGALFVTGPDPGNPNLPDFGPRFVKCTFSQSMAVNGGAIGTSPAEGDRTRLHLINCTIQLNKATGEGGGLYGGRSILRNSRVLSNISTSDGGGAHFYSAFTLLNCTVSGNSSDGPGGGVFSKTGSSDMRSCYISDNSGCDGGGLWQDDSTVNLVNCAFVNNEATGSGSCDGIGGGAGFQQNGQVINCTFAGNVSAAAGGAGIRWIGTGLPPPPLKISNTILWDNVGNGSQNEAAQLSGNTTTNVTVRYNVIEGLSTWSGNNNDGETQPDDDPLFVNLALGDVRLMNDVQENIISPYIDTANDSDIPRDCTYSSENPCVTTQDLAECDVDEDECGCERMPDEDQGPRVVGSHGDRGAYEVPPDCPADFSGPEGVPDGEVNVFDLFILLAAWNLPPPSDPNCSDQDYYYPGALVPDRHIVGQGDLFALLAAWGDCENPPGFIPEDEQDCIDEFGLDPENFEKLQACLEAVWLMQQE